MRYENLDLANGNPDYGIDVEAARKIWQTFLDKGFEITDSGRLTHKELGLGEVTINAVLLDEKNEQGQKITVLNVGVNAFGGKPIDPRELMRVLGVKGGMFGSAFNFPASQWLGEDRNIRSVPSVWLRDKNREANVVFGSGGFAVTTGLLERNSLNALRHVHNDVAYNDALSYSHAAGSYFFDKGITEDVLAPAVSAGLVTSHNSRVVTAMLRPRRLASRDEVEKGFYCSLTGALRIDASRNGKTGKKKNMPGSDTSVCGGFLPLGKWEIERANDKQEYKLRLPDGQSKVVLCEGVATAASVAMAGYSAIACYDAGSMTKVAGVIGRYLPKGTTFVIAADNDFRHKDLEKQKESPRTDKQNTGMKHAITSVVKLMASGVRRGDIKVTCCPRDYLLPKHAASDINDLHEIYRTGDKWLKIAQSVIDGAVVLNAVGVPHITWSHDTKRYGDIKVYENQIVSLGEYGVLRKYQKPDASEFVRVCKAPVYVSPEDKKNADDRKFYYMIYSIDGGKESVIEYGSFVMPRGVTDNSDFASIKRPARDGSSERMGIEDAFRVIEENMKFIGGGGKKLAQWKADFQGKILRDLYPFFSYGGKGRSDSAPFGAEVGRSKNALLDGHVKAVVARFEEIGLPCRVARGNNDRVVYVPYGITSKEEQKEFWGYRVHKDGSREFGKLSGKDCFISAMDSEEAKFFGRVFLGYGNRADFDTLHNARKNVLMQNGVWFALNCDCKGVGDCDGLSEAVAYMKKDALNMLGRSKAGEKTFALLESLAQSGVAVMAQYKMNENGEMQWVRGKHGKTENHLKLRIVAPKSYGIDATRDWYWPCDAVEIAKLRDSCLVAAQRVAGDYDDVSLLGAGKTAERGEDVQRGVEEPRVLAWDTAQFDVIDSVMNQEKGIDDDYVRRRNPPSPALG